MSIGEWNLDTAGAATISQESSNPIEGTGSYDFDKGQSFDNVAMLRNVPAERNKLAGAIQAAYNPVLNLHSGSGTKLYYGVVYLIDEDVDITAAASTPTFYLAGYNPAGAGGGTVNVWRYVNRDLGTEPTLLGSVTAPTIAQDTPFTMQVEWRQDSGSIGGVQSIIRMGTALDFTDLAEVLNVTDTIVNGAQMGPSFGEGFAWSAISGNPGAFNPSTLRIDAISGFNSAQQ